MDGESLREEYLVTCSHHTAVVQVDVVHEKPSADTIVGQFAAFFSQLHDILVEEQSHLIF